MVFASDAIGNCGLFVLVIDSPVLKIQRVFLKSYRVRLFDGYMVDSLYTTSMEDKKKEKNYSHCCFHVPME